MFSGATAGPGVQAVLTSDFGFFDPSSVTGSPKKNFGISVFGQMQSHVGHVSVNFFELSCFDFNPKAGVGAVVSTSSEKCLSHNTKYK